MLRPLLLDFLSFLFAPLTGLLAFVLGRFLAGWPRVLLYAAVALALGTIGGAIASLARLLPAEVDAAISWLGGATTGLCWTALFLLGIVWSVPNRSFSSGFL